MAELERCRVLRSPSVGSGLGVLRDECEWAPNGDGESPAGDGRYDWARCIADQSGVLIELLPYAGELAYEVTLEWYIITGGVGRWNSEVCEFVLYIPV